MIDKKNFLRVDLLLVALMCILLIIPYLKYISRGMIGFLIVFMLWCIIVFRNGIKVSFVKVIRENILLFMLLGSFILINVVMYIFINSSDKALSWIFTLFYFVLFLVVKMYYNEKEIGVILFYIILALGLNSLISIPYILNSTEFVSRLMASGQLDEGENIEALKNGVGTNALYTSNVLFVFLGIRFKSLFTRKRRLLFILSLILIVISIIISTFLASVLLLFLGMFLYFMLSSNDKNSRSIKVVLVACILSIAIFWNYLKRVDINFLKPIFFKIDSFVGNSGGVKDVTGRAELTQATINSFLENPLFGIGVPEWQSYKLIGEHVFWLDLFAHYGILGSLPFILFILLFLPFVYYYRQKEISLFVCAVLIIASSFIAPMIMTNNTLIAFILFIGLKKKNAIHVI
ncbi:O-antigen ligase family protein [Myroides odoratimimus]|uniref:O-antigen ligase-related domain-containing protein n=1 Tax=Myroides odoratimimus CIP 101113 TaxID=883154 RepID=A0AAV3F255_9FLAO|nr:O-antigen ligase family protein [Myroides odoratimimus]EHO09922.1 hypothetical protein HMPREF9715_02223 [Myroides odoratimimus CIP 101113]